MVVGTRRLTAKGNDEEEEESRRWHGLLSVDSVVLTGTGLGDELIHRPGRPYRPPCVIMI